MLSQRKQGLIQRLSELEELGTSGSSERQQLEDRMQQQEESSHTTLVAALMNYA